MLGLIIEAALQRQLATTHPDLIHVTAHFIKSASVAPFEVHIRILKSGRAFSNLTADFIQEVNPMVCSNSPITGVLKPPL